MDIQKEQNSFKKTMLDQHGEYDEEHFELDNYGNFSWIGTDDHFEIWMLCAKAKQAEIDELKGKLAKAQAVPDTYTPIVLALEDVQSKIEKTSFLTMDAENESEVYAVDANEISAYIDELIEAQEPK